ncbi:alcohol dehydrogenase [Exophiala aquamarina CBS 119918]|uniref:Alcohol dehydrogenase n=1 Tax=Exophiala aquamarina CBS 119918 TaxID=1182545 RepID=A0A072NZN9_9EURO|nr:alcohol dehydrogenase [Exophiala aquamarina CBS 119918]KEF53314.1 alcohol dehydrogenase [Exophiala aquamarina CBS 119918]
MPYSLKGRNVLVTGGSRGLGALIAEKFAAEGANVVVNYVTSKERAVEVAEKIKTDYGVKAHVLQADIGVIAESQKLVKDTVELLGGLDVIINNAGWTRFATFGDINDLSHDEWNKCWSTNVMSHLVLLQEAAPIFNANPDGGVFLISSSVAGITTGGSSMGYAVTKAAGLHLMKCMAFTQGPKIRLNAVLPGLLLTEWGQKYGEDRIKANINMTALKHETYLDDCADAFIASAKNTSQTGQQIVVGRSHSRHDESHPLTLQDAGLVIK